MSLNSIVMEENVPLIDQYPLAVKIISLEQWNEVCCDTELSNLLIILNQDNKTLDEITAHYKEKFEEKSKTTMHRYLKNYIEKGFIIESGRIIKGKQHTAEKLYTTSAKIFFIDNQYLDTWNQGDRSIILASKIGIIAQRKFNDKGFDFEKMQQLFHSYEMFIRNTAFNSLENNQKDHPEIVDDILKLDNDEKLVFFSILKNSFFYLTKGKVEAFLQDLKSIFVKKPLDVEHIIKESMNKDQKFSQLLIEKPQGYQINYTRKQVYFTNFDKYTKYMLDLNYNAITIILGTNNYPLTIKAITEKFPLAYELAFNNYSCKLADKESLKKWEENKEATKDLYKNLSENRIYRLVQDLKNDGLVIEAGRQISKDSSKTSILYTTAGKRTIYLENRDEFWKQESKWDKLVLLIAKIFSFYYNKNTIDKKLFYELFTKIEKIKFESYKEMLADIQNEDISNFYYHSLNVIELNSSISALGSINMFFQKEDILELVGNLQKIFL